MAVPGFQDLTLPVLQQLSDGREHQTREVRERVAQQLGLRADDLGEMLPIGRQSRFAKEALKNRS